MRRFPGVLAGLAILTITATALVASVMPAAAEFHAW